MELKCAKRSGVCFRCPRKQPGWDGELWRDGHLGAGQPGHHPETTGDGDAAWNYGLEVESRCGEMGPIITTAFVSSNKNRFGKRTVRFQNIMDSRNTSVIKWASLDD